MVEVDRARRQGQEEAAVDALKEAPLAQEESRVGLEEEAKALFEVFSQEVPAEATTLGPIELYHGWLCSVLRVASLNLCEDPP